MMFLKRSLTSSVKFNNDFSNVARTTIFGKSSNSIFKNTISLSSNKDYAVKFFQSKPSWNLAATAAPKRWREDTPTQVKETTTKRTENSEKIEAVAMKETASHPQTQLHEEIEKDPRYSHQYDEQFSSPRITVLGIGGAGSNALNTMIDSNLSGVEFIVANTDAQALGMSKAHKKFQLGRKVTRGLGAGAKPHMGKEAAKESLDELMREIGNSHMLFLTAGMGGGTGTGACPIIAEAARTHGILTVGIVTTPFQFEGKRRMQIAEEGIRELEKSVDTLIVIPNQKLLLLEDKQKHTWMNSFKMVDNVLLNGIRTVTDLLVIPGEINLDFADVNTVMKGMGRALLGTGEAEGHGRSKMAALGALHNPLLEDMPVKGAKGVLINIYGGNDLGLGEVEEISNTVHESVDPDANIIFGTSYDEKLTGKVRVSLIVTGMTKNESNPKKEAATPPIKSTQAKPSEKGKDEKPEKKGSFFETLKKYW